MERGLLDPREEYERYRLNFSPFAGFREVALGLAGVSCFVWIWDQASSLGLCLEGERSMGFIGVQTRDGREDCQGCSVAALTMRFRH